MEKKLILIEGPCTTRSGYGEHCRSIIKSMIQIYPNDQIIIVPTPWGDTPRTEWVGQDEESIEMQKLVLRSNTLPKQPDIYVQVTVPSEFRRVGHYNIGITAGIETTLCSKEWLTGLNHMDLIIVPSEFAKKTLTTTQWEQVNNQTKQVEQIFKLNKVCEVLFEGLDLNVYKNLQPEELKNQELKQYVDNIPEDFVFLYLGHWLKGEVTHDRKDITGLIKTFLETFKDQEQQPALLLKTCMGKFSIIDKTVVIEQINNIKNTVTGKLPKIYLLHGDLTDEEVNELYNHPKVKAMVSFTKGEGFGRPLLEFGVTKKPILASNWSGQLDFLRDDTSVLLPGELKNVHPSASWDKVIIQESKWFYVDYTIASKKLMDVYKNYKNYLSKAEKQYKNVQNFTMDKMTEKFKVILDKYVTFKPQTMNFNLPQLKKLGDIPKDLNLPKLNMPTLNKLK